jgi:transposase
MGASIGNGPEIGRPMATQLAFDAVVSARHRASEVIALDHRRPLEALFGNVVRTRVERIFAWLGRNRRLAKDFEATVTSAVTMAYLASLQLLVRRLARA